MRKLAFALTLAGLLLAGMFGLLQVARGQGVIGPDQSQILQNEVQGENRREITAPANVNSPQQPAISFIDSPSPTCYQPDPAQDECYINWYYAYVDANPSYMIAMTVTLNAVGIVSMYQGFFQTSMYTPYDMRDRGFKVACGAPGAGGNPNLGNAYSWTISARASDGLKSANHGTIYCPPYTP